MSAEREPDPASPEIASSEPIVDGLYRGDDDLPGVPLSILLFACSEHGEERTVEYYDPDHPPRCSHGDLMSRKPR